MCWKRRFYSCTSFSSYLFSVFSCSLYFSNTAKLRSSWWSQKPEAWASSHKSRPNPIWFMVFVICLDLAPLEATFNNPYSSNLEIKLAAAKDWDESEWVELLHLGQVMEPLLSEVVYVVQIFSRDGCRCLRYQIGTCDMEFVRWSCSVSLILILWFDDLWIGLRLVAQ